MEKPPRNSTVVQQRWIGNWQLRTTHWKAFKVELLWLLAMPAEGDFLQQALLQLRGRGTECSPMGSDLEVWSPAMNPSTPGYSIKHHDGITEWISEAWLPSDVYKHHWLLQ